MEPAERGGAHPSTAVDVDSELCMHASRCNALVRGKTYTSVAPMKRVQRSLTHSSQRTPRMQFVRLAKCSQRRQRTKFELGATKDEPVIEGDTPATFTTVHGIGTAEGTHTQK
eukprot:1515332-Pleurochrysis_carterae.AAC.1